MKLPQILRILKEEPLLITPGAHSALLKLFEDHARLGADQFRMEREGTGPCGEKVDLEQAEVIDGILHIPIGGPIGQRLGSFEKGAGAVDVDDLASELKSGMEDDEVRAVLLDFDSPGGMVSGTPELADLIARCDKPIYAYTSGTIASGAYWLAAACDYIAATRSADIGSIGAYIAYLDLTEMYRQEGVKVDLIKTGKYKGMGYPGTPLSDAQRENLQQRVNDIAKMFYAHVQGNRPDVTADSMQGQTFMAADAFQRGLIDQVVRDKQEVLDLLG